MIDIGTLGSALSAAKTVYDFVKQIQDAPQDIKALQQEVFLAHELLFQLICILNADTGPCVTERNQAQLQVLAEQARTLIESANAFLAETTTEAEYPKSNTLTKTSKLLRGVRGAALRQELDTSYDDSVGTGPAASGRDESCKPKKISWIWNTERKTKLVDSFRTFKVTVSAVINLHIV